MPFISIADEEVRVEDGWRTRSPMMIKLFETLSEPDALIFTDPEIVEFEEIMITK